MTRAGASRVHSDLEFIFREVLSLKKRLLLQAYFHIHAFELKFEVIVNSRYFELLNFNIFLSKFFNKSFIG